MTFDPGKRLDTTQVEDRRGGGIGTPILVGGGGIGLTVLVLVVSLLMGVDPTQLLNTLPTTQEVDNSQSLAQCQTGLDANQRTDCRVVGFVDSVQQYWSDDLARRGRSYSPAKTVLFTQYTEAGCGVASTAMGPFYCPQDGKVYLDIAFFDELHTRFGAQGGPLAEGYVIAHEYGHHVQDLLGLLSSSSATGANSQSVRTELMADCLAGVWAKNAVATGYLQSVSQADVAAALDAAASVGDDRIQQETQGRVQPETWTHGSAEQRQQAFAAGFTAGDLNACTR